jgi:hypothetical protein
MMSSKWVVACCVVSLAAMAGCSEKPALAPVSGTVFYKDKPVEAGVVMFQPPVGEIARGQIGPDGKYVLETLGQGEGVILGNCKVRVSVRSKPANSGGEVGLGKLLIPEKYTYFDRSGLTFEVNGDRTEPYDIHLTD